MMLRYGMAFASGVVSTLAATYDYSSVNSAFIGVFSAGTEMFTFGKGYYGMVIDSGAEKQLTGSIPIRGY